MSERDKMLMWAAWRELNEIRARDGVPYTHQLITASVDPGYFSDVVDGLEAALGDDAKPWPAKRWLDQDGSFNVLSNPDDVAERLRGTEP